MREIEMKKIIKIYAVADPKGNIKDWEDNPSLGSAIASSKKMVQEQLDIYQRSHPASWKNCKVKEVMLMIE